VSVAALMPGTMRMWVYALIAKSIAPGLKRMTKMKASKAASEIMDKVYLISRRPVDKYTRKQMAALLNRLEGTQEAMINHHIPTMTITERRRAELVKAGLYRGQLVNS